MESNVEDCSDFPHPNQDTLIACRLSMVTTPASAMSHVSAHFNIGWGDEHDAIISTWLRSMTQNNSQMHLKLNAK